MTLFASSADLGTQKVSHCVLGRPLGGPLDGPLGGSLGEGSRLHRVETKAVHGGRQGDHWKRGRRSYEINGTEGSISDDIFLDLSVCALDFTDRRSFSQVQFGQTHSPVLELSDLCSSSRVQFGQTHSPVCEQSDRRSPSRVQVGQTHSPGWYPAGGRSRRRLVRQGPTSTMPSLTMHLPHSRICDTRFWISLM